MYLIVSEFANWLRTTKWYSKSTIENYCRTLRALDDFIKITSQGERGVSYPHTIDLEDVEEFSQYLKKSEKDIKTINNYMFGIRMFLKFCTHKGLKVLDYRRILIAREPEKKINALSGEDMKKLLSYMKSDPTKKEIARIRDYAMWLILLYWGLRVQELCDLMIDDIKENLQVVGKWGSRRLVYLNPEHIKVVELYLFLRRKIWIKSPYVFTSHSGNSLGNKISRASVESIIREAGEKSWVWKIRPHKLRHTCATQMLENWWEVTYISQIMGHKNIRTTQIYLDYNNEKLKKTQNLIPLM